VDLRTSGFAAEILGGLLEWYPPYGFTRFNAKKIRKEIPKSIFNGYLDSGLGPEWLHLFFESP
jgi:hypothetical protein